MELKHLAEFEAIARNGSYIKAAEELNISQSSLSKHISALEAEFNIKFFYRSSHKVALTEAGERFLETAKNVTVLMDDLTTSLDAIRSNSRPRLLVVAQCLMVHCGVMDAIWAFQEKYPNIPIRASDKAHRFQNPFIFDDVTFAFTRRIPVTGSSKYEYTMFMPDVYAIAVPSSHPFASRDFVTWRDLVGLHIFCLSEEQSMILQLNMHRLGAKADINILYKVGLETALHFVRHDGSILLCSKQKYENFKTPGTKALVIKPYVERNLYLARRKGEILSKEGQLFWLFIQDNYADKTFSE